MGRRAEVQSQEPPWKERKNSQGQAYGIARHKSAQRVVVRRRERGEIRKDHEWGILGKCPTQNKSAANILCKPSVVWEKGMLCLFSTGLLHLITLLELG